MVALFAFFAGLYYDLPLGYFMLGFIILLLDDDGTSNNSKDAGSK